jgi:hypothetical protein
MGLFPIVAFGPFMILGVWLLLDSRRSRLLVAARTIVLRGVARIKRLRFSDVTRATWEIHGGLKLRLQTPRGRTTIDIDSFDQPDRLVPLLRESIDGTRQEGWDEAKMDRYLTSRREMADPQSHTRLYRRRARLLLIGPVAGLLIGAAYHASLGFPNPLGWTSNLTLIGLLAGIGASAVMFLLGYWNWWMERP